MFKILGFLLPVSHNYPPPVIPIQLVAEQHSQQEALSGSDIKQTSPKVQFYLTFHSATLKTQPPKTHMETNTGKVTLEEGVSHLNTSLLSAPQTPRTSSDIEMFYLLQATTE